MLGGHFETLSQACTTLGLCQYCLSKGKIHRLSIFGSSLPQSASQTQTLQPHTSPQSSSQKRFLLTCGGVNILPGSRSTKHIIHFLQLGVLPVCYLTNNSRSSGSKEAESTNPGHQIAPSTKTYFLQHTPKGHLKIPKFLLSQSRTHHWNLKNPGLGCCPKEEDSAVCSHS